MTLDVETRDKLAEAFKMFLRQTTNHCEYKKAHVPEGWAHVHIETTGPELVELLVKELQKIT